VLWSNSAPRKPPLLGFMCASKNYFDQANTDLIMNLQTAATQPLFKRAKLTTAAFSATTNDKILVAV
jgi:hypothetical protein